MKTVFIDKNNKMKEIKNGAFERCFSLEDFSLPASVKFIGQYAFASNRYMKSFDIPANSELEYISYSALGDIGIKTIYISAQTRVADNFLYGKELKEINIDAANPYYKFTGDVLYNIACDTVMAYATGTNRESVVLDKKTKCIVGFYFNADYLKKMYLLSDSVPYVKDISYTGSTDPTADFVSIESNLVVYVRESIYDDFKNRYKNVHAFKDIIAITDQEADEIATAIKEVENTKSQNENNGYYNLNGIKIQEPFKGVYIHNGKKMVAGK